MHNSKVFVLCNFQDFTADMNKFSLIAGTVAIH